MLQSYTQRDAYIVTQMPLPNTVSDFWRLLYDYHSDTVVMLNEFDRNDTVNIHPDPLCVAEMFR